MRVSKNIARNIEFTLHSLSVLESVANKRQLCHMPVHTPNPTRKGACCAESGPKGTQYGLLEKSKAVLLITLVTNRRQKH